MKCVQVLLSFIVILRWASGEHFSVEGKSRFFNNKALRNLVKFMDVEADPCKNFYEYACGNWAEEHEDVAYVSATSMMDVEVSEELATTVEVMNYRNKTEFVKNAKNYFMSCNTESNTYNLSNFISWLEKHDKISWQNTESEYNWAKALGLMRRYGMNNIFLAENIENNIDDISKMTIGLDKPSSIHGNFTEETVERVRQEIPEDYLSESDWDEIIVFNNRLEELYSVSDEDDKQVTTVRKLPLPWLKRYLAAMFNKTSVDPTLEISIHNIPYMKALDDVLNEYSDEFVYKYLQVRFLAYLDDTASVADTLQCIHTTRTLLTLPTTFIYEQQHPEILEEFPKIFSLFDNIMAQIKKTLLSDENGIVPDSVVEKLDTIQLKVGKLPRVETIHVLESLYSGLTTDPRDFYGNHLKILSFNFNISHTVNTGILTANVSQYFDLKPYEYGVGSLPYFSRNIVIVPVTLLRQPFYHWAYSDFSIYSALGVRLAQTILSALDLDVAAAEDEVTEIAALHIAFDTFFSNLPEDYKEKQLAANMQKAFVLKSAQYFCNDESNETLPKTLNKFIPHSSKFSELFECKFNAVLDAVSKF